MGTGSAWSPPRTGGEDVLLTELDGRFWTAEVTASFTGRVVGLFATEGTVTFTRFHAEGSDAQASLTTPPWHEVQIELTAEASYASPYTDVEVWADFTCGDDVLRRPAFWDGGEPVVPALRGAVRRRLGLGVGGERRRPRARRSRRHGHLPRRAARPDRDARTSTASGGCRRRDASWSTPTARRR